MSCGEPSYTITSVPTAYLPRATLLKQLTAGGVIVAATGACAGLDLRRPVLHRAADLAGEVRVVERVQTQSHVPPRAELVELHPAVTARVQARHDLCVLLRRQLVPHLLAQPLEFFWVDELVLVRVWARVRLGISWG